MTEGGADGVVGVFSIVEGGLCVAVGFLVECWEG